MKYLADTHTHTLASGHAYNTIMEMAKGAKEAGLSFLGITEHSMKMPSTCQEFYFSNLKTVDREIFGIELALGTELNIMDYEGNVDMQEWMMKEMDITIASFHAPCIEPGTREENTNALVRCCENSLINILGHPDDGRYPVDFEKVVSAANRTKTLLEVNNSSLTPGGFRINTRENDIEMLKWCMKFETPVVIGSDAHFVTKVGNHQYAQKVMEEVGFPMELVLNYKPEELKNYINKYKFIK